MNSGFHGFEINVAFKIQIFVHFFLCLVFVIFMFLLFLGCIFLIFYVYIFLFPGISQNICVYLVIVIFFI